MVEPSTLISHNTAQPNHHHHLPAIPDLRYESSYLKKIEPYVEVNRTDSTNDPGPDESPREVINVRWKMVIWVTIRDQVVSPFMQGIFLGLFGYLWTALRVRSVIREKRAKVMDGKGVKWIKRWSQNLGLANRN